MGTWLCYDFETNGKHSFTPYLSLTFNGKSLFISDAPFDPSNKNVISYGKDYFRLWDNSAKEEIKFIVEYVSKDSLTLKQKKGEKTNRYFFLKDIFFKELPACFSDTLTIRTVLVEYKKNWPSKKEKTDSIGMSSMLNFELKYLISSAANCFHPPPFFLHSSKRAFNSFFIERFNGKSLNGIQNVNREFVCVARITKRGLTEIQLLGSLSDSFDSHILKILKLSSPFWKQGSQHDLNVKFSITILNGERATWF